MKTWLTRVAFVLAAVLTLPTAGAGSPEKAPEADTPEKAAQSGAEQWMTLVDADNYAESWKQAASIFKEKLPAEQWESAVKELHSKTGKLVSRKLRVSELTSDLPGAPAGEYVILKYDAVFENFKTATETVIPYKEKDGSWRVCGYFVK